MLRTLSPLNTVISLLVLISFFTFLALGEWISDKIFRAGLIGQILVGLIYGMPISNIMPIGWQETFVSLGYIGLILIIFEGGLSVRLDLLKKNFLLSLVGATIGVVIPIALCYCLLYLGFGFGESFPQKYILRHVENFSSVILLLSSESPCLFLSPSHKTKTAYICVHIHIHVFYVFVRHKIGWRRKPRKAKREKKRSSKAPIREGGTVGAQ